MLPQHPVFSSENEDEVDPMSVRRLSTAHETAERALCMPQDKRGTYIARLIICLEECLKQLGVSIKTHDNLLVSLERISCFIHESMSISSRNYHSVQHVFDVAEGLKEEDPIAVIAALFHDCVYYHVDGGLSDLQYDKLRGVMSDQARAHQPGVPLSSSSSSKQLTTFYQAKTSDPLTETDDAVLCIVERVFGYIKGQHVNHQNGLNEFLSAVICVREMEPFLPKPILAQLACCIEATIPFRGKDEETGQTCSEKLFDRMIQVNTCFDMGFSHNELVQSIQRAVGLSNSDLSNFGAEDVLWFLDNTWSLLPESNEGLRRQYLSSVQQFQCAVFKMYGFFNFLKADMIFRSFQGKPSLEALETQSAHAARNLELGRKYVGAKLLSLSVLAAFAELTGGDAPISLFMGDLPSRTQRISTVSGQSGKSGLRNSRILSFSERIVEESQLYPDNETATNIDAAVYEVLSKGRRTETSFDVKQSPMAAYLYSILGDEELSAILQNVQFHPMTQDTAWNLLRRLPRSAVIEISKHIQYVAISRTEKIAALILNL